MDTYDIEVENTTSSYDIESEDIRVVSGVSDVKVNGTSVVQNNVALVTTPTKTSDLTNDSGFIDNTYHDSTKQDTLTAGTNITIENNVISASGGSGSTNYNDLTNKPTINNVELQGNKTLEELGLDLSVKEDTFRYENMPEASVGNLNRIVEYIGTTNSNYTNGYYYQCVDNSTQESITATQTDNVIPLGNITVNANTFKSKVDGAGTYEFVYRPYNTKLTYMNISAFPPTTINVTRDGMFDRQPIMPNATPMYSWVDGANNFYVTNTLQPTSETRLYLLDISTNEMTDTGCNFVSSNTPSEIEGRWTKKTGDVYEDVEISDYGIYLVSTGVPNNAISVNYVEANTSYQWVQKDIQPNSTYTLPIANTTTLGGIKPDGTSISVDENGVASVSAGTNITVVENTSTSNPFVFSGKPVGLYVVKDPTKVFYYKGTEENSSYRSISKPMPIFYIYKEYDDASIDEYFSYMYENNYGAIKSHNVKKATGNTGTGGVTNNLGFSVVTSANQSFEGHKTFNASAFCSVTPSDNNELTNKKYVDEVPTKYSGYDATKTQVLKNINGTFTWVDE